ncbi:MAG: S41 family peptidase [Phycisphaerales bacterium]
MSIKLMMHDPRGFAVWMGDRCSCAARSIATPAIIGASAFFADVGGAAGAAGAPDAADAGAAADVGRTDAVYRPVPLSAEQASEDVRILIETLDRLHAGWGRYTADEAMRSLLDGLARSVVEGSTDADMFAKINRVLPHLRCDHTLAEPPAAIETHREVVATHFPFTFRLFDGAMYVDRVSAVAADSLARGDRIDRINGRSVHTIIREIEPLISVDGWTDDVRGATLEATSELLGSGIEHHWPFVFGWAGTWDVEVARRTPGGAWADPRVVRVPAITWPESISMRTGGDARYLDFVDGMDFSLRARAAPAADEPPVGVLRIDTFVNYRRPVDPREAFAPAFRALAEAGATHLIIDLRACGGGSTEVPDELLSRLVAVPPAAAARRPWTRGTGPGDLRPHLSTWDPSVFALPPGLFQDLGNGFQELRMPLDPPPAAHDAANRFDGRLTVLIGPVNASGATVFAALLDAHRPNVRFVGEPTGGSAEGPTAGTIAFLTLPHSGVQVRVPLLRSWVNVPHPPAGLGVEPDVLIRPTVADWLAGRDPVLEAALAP